MKIFDLVRLILGNLSRRKARVALTAIGVVIGTAAVVILVSLAIGLQKNANEQLYGIGDLTQIQFMPAYEMMEGFVEPTPDPSMGGGGGGEVIPGPTEETTLQKVWRFVLGLFGLDSAPPSTNDPGVSPEPGIEEPVVPIPKPGTGKG